ncbi:pirin family protein [Symbiopectobacterium sp. Eva_TO]
MCITRWVWVHHLQLDEGEQHTFTLNGNRAYFQVVHGAMEAMTPQENATMLQCGDGAFIQQEKQLTIRAKAPLRALLIDPGCLRHIRPTDGLSQRDPRLTW